MNAIVESSASREMPAPRAQVAAPHATQMFKMLLKREFWEHKGGFFWAPLVAAGIFLLLSLMGFGVGQMASRNIPDNAQVNIDGGSFKVNGLNLGDLTEKMSAQELRDVGGMIDLSLLMSASWPLMVLAFVVFFYCLGSLYDDRKDRSVLFWKSLPLSDSATVLSKVASAAVVAPILAIAVGVLAMFGFMIVASGMIMLHGGNPMTLLWGPSSPLKVAGFLIASLPIYALWAMPTIGWLMLCSSWARSKPFLWAIMIPVFAGILVTWFDLMQVFHLETTWFWKNIVARSLVSVVPGSWFDVATFAPLQGDGPSAVSSALSLQSMYSVLVTPQLWIGVVVGAAMIIGAIRLRRWRDEG